MGIAGEQGLILQLGIAKGYFMRITYFRIVKLSDFDQKLDNTRIHNSLECSAFRLLARGRESAQIALS